MVDGTVVHVADLESGVAPYNFDCNGKGTSLRDFRRASDLAPMPEHLVARYDRGYGDNATHDNQVLVYQPS